MTLDEFIEEVRVIQGQRQAVEYVYDFLSEKYYGDRIKWFTYIAYLWKHIDLQVMRSKGGPVQCMHINRLFKYIMVQSGQFEDNDVMLKRTFPHQYVIIKNKDGTSNCIDIRGKKYGIPFGDYSKPFYSKEK